jgi:hypothetical protein
MPSRDDLLLDQHRDVVAVFGLNLFCRFEAGVTEFDAQPLLRPTL